MYAKRQMTTAQLAAQAAAYQAEIGSEWKVTPNGYGMRVECTKCRASATHDGAYKLPRSHTC